ncbi:unnamed protein product [Rodentolepis nana]|uniref:non-specific serine/threonine protein kinase n=1 Tax=Rodentolepis nana TaxID=102285 RepID=A0A0R3TGK8_RODNA|nr:unnamed protein product [Rodentolepis nana]
MSAFSVTGEFSVRILKVLNDNRQMVSLLAYDTMRGVKFTITLKNDDIPVSFSSELESSSPNKSFFEKVEERYKVKYGLMDIKFHLHFLCQNENKETRIHHRHFIIEDELGEGTYGTVFKLKDIESDENFAIKCVKYNNPHRVDNEIRILRMLRNSRNIIHFYGAVYLGLLNRVCLVTEHVDSIVMKDVLDSLDLDDIKYYSHQLLIAIDECHKRNIVHGDIKPANVLIDITTKELKLIDFGMAVSLGDNESNKTNIGTLIYNAPELLLNYTLFDGAVDIWAFGCIFACAIFRLRRLFEGDTRKEVLQSITSMLGSDHFFGYIGTYGIRMSVREMDDFTGFPVQTWDSLITEENSDLAIAEAVDLIEHLLVFDHEKRISAEEAMKHSFFNQ